MKQNEIDKLFHDKLADGNFEYKQAYWQNLKPEIAGSKVGAFGLLNGKAILGVAFLFVSIASAAWWFTSQSNSNPEQIAPDSSNAVTIETKSTDPISNINTPTSNTQNTNNNQEESIADETAQQSNKKANEPAVATSTRNNAPLTKSETIKKTVDNKTVKPQEYPKSQIEIRNSRNTDQDGRPTDPITISGEDNFRPTEPASTQVKPAKSEKSIAASNPKNTADDSKSTSAEMDDPQPNDADKASVSATKLPSKKPNLRPNTTQKTQISSKKPNDLVAPKPRKARWQTNLGVEYTQLFAQRSLSTTDANLSRVVDFRDQYELAKTINSTGISVQIERNGWMLNSGVNYTTFREQINYPSTLNVLTGVDNGFWEKIENWSFAVDSNWVIDSIFAGHWNYDTAWSVVYDSTYINQWDSVYTDTEDPELAKNNKIAAISYLEIPLLVGHSFAKGRWIFDLQVGGSIGILTGTSGSVYINNRVDGLQTAGAHRTQFRQYNGALLLRTGVRYALSPEIQATLYPTFRYGVTNAFKSDAIRQKYWGYGLTFGLRYRL